MADGARIEAVEPAAYRFPTDAPEADGTLEWEATEILVVRVRAGGREGLGYSYTAAKAAADLVRDKLAGSLLGEHAFDLPRLWTRMNEALRNAGRPGLGLMAIAAVDVALWDLNAKLLGIPLTRLWGRARQTVPVYGSGGFTTYGDRRLRGQIERWAEEGIRTVKVKIGTGVEEDLHRIRTVEQALEPGMALMVDANGAYHTGEALKLVENMTDGRVDWLEEPVSSDDLTGLRRVRERAPSGMDIAAGEYGWDVHYFRHMLETEAVDVLQADATRCGYTGFLQAAALCEAFNIPLSGHCAPALHAPICAAVTPFRHLEWFHDHVRLESTFFDGIPRLKDGALIPVTDQPGHGLRLRETDLGPYRL